MVSDRPLLLGGGAVGLRRRLPILVLVSAWIACFWPTWRLWAISCLSNPQYEHGPVLATLSVAMLLRLPSQTVDPRGPQLPWVGALAFTSLSWLVAWLGGFAVPQELLVLCAGWIAIRCVFGPGAARMAVLPVFWLLLASEVCEYAAIPLQAFTARGVSAVLGMADFPVYVEGNHISIRAGEFAIEEGCSGVKYFITLLALAMLTIRSANFSAAARWAILTCAAVLAILANWLRVVTLVLIGEATNLRHPLMHDHYLFGWLLFAAALVPYVVFVRWLRRHSAQSAAALPGREVPVERSRWATARMLAMLGGAVCGPVAALSLVTGGLAVPLRVEMNAAASEWQGPAPLEVPRVVGYRGPDLRYARFVSPRGTVTLGAVRMRPPLESDLLEPLLAGAHGPGKVVVTGTSSDRVIRLDGSVIQFSERELATTLGERKIVRFWFTAGGRSFAHSAPAKLATALHTPVGAEQMTILVAESDCTRTCDASRRLLDDFMRDLSR